MINNLPYDMIIYITKKTRDYLDLSNLRITCQLFNNAIPFIRLKQAKLEYLINVNNNLNKCVNEDCYWDSYLDVYDTHIDYRRYIHTHQSALNCVMLIYNNGKNIKYTNIPYCYDCMKKYLPTQIYP